MCKTQIAYQEMCGDFRHTHECSNESADICARIVKQLGYNDTIRFTTHYNEYYSVVRKEGHYTAMLLSDEVGDLILEESLKTSEEFNTSAELCRWIVKVLKYKTWERRPAEKTNLYNI